MSKEQIEVELNPCVDDLYTEIEKADIEYIYQIGGRWSGKTYGILQLMILIGFIYPGYQWGIFRKVYSSIKDSVFEELIGVLEDMNIPYHWDSRVSPLKVMLINGTTFKFKGLDSTEKTKGLAKLHGFFLEELNEFMEMDFETIDNGIRGKGFPFYGFMAHNPVPHVPGSQYWFQEMFGETFETGKVIKKRHNSLGDILVLKTTYQHNLFCPQKRKDRLESYKETNPTLYQLWAKGEYAEIQGLVFDNIKYIQELPEGLGDCDYSLDWGFSPDPAAMIRVYKVSNKIYIIPLVYVNNLTNEQLYDRIKSTGVLEYDTIIADSAEKKSIQDMYDRGLRGIRGVKKGPHYKEDLVNVLRAYEINILETDINIRREFSTYSWQRDKSGAQIPKLQDGNDHYVDCLFMWARERLRQKKEISFHRR